MTPPGKPDATPVTPGAGAAPADDLAGHFGSARVDRIELTFEEIEGLLGRPLPGRARRAAWWSSADGRNRRPSRAWRSQGFHARLIRGTRRVVFERETPLEDGYGRWVWRGTERVERYTALDPALDSFRCTCGRADCPRARLLPFRDHIADLYRILGECVSLSCVLDTEWDGVLYALRMAASVSDIEADTGYVEDPLSFALCEVTIDVEDAASEMASKYVAAVVVFNFLWMAYEAAVSLTVPDEFRTLLKGGRLGERGRRLFEAHPELKGRLKGLSDLIKLARYYARIGLRFEARLEKVFERYPGDGLVTAAELSREFRNFIVHGEDEVPTHPDWSGEPRQAAAGFGRFYVIGRLLLYQIQALAWLSVEPTARLESGLGDEETPEGVGARDILERLQFQA